MPTTNPELSSSWRRRVIVLGDVVDSVRLTLQDEAGFIARWQRFVAEVANDWLPRHQGRLVKSLGDGLLLEFETVHEAMTVAHGLHRALERAGAGAPPDQTMLLRVGAHVARLVSDSWDVYGAGVNLCARIAGAAAPGEVLVSAEARAEIVEALDGSVEDKGLCYLKNIENPQRLFRVHPPDAAGAAGADEASAKPGVARMPKAASLLPRLAVAPVLAQGTAQPLAAPLADNLVAALARSPHWQVSSRLATGALAARGLRPGQVASLLGVQYVLVCQLLERSGALELVTEIHEATSQQMVWQGAHRAAASQLLGPEDPFITQLTQDIATALLKRQIDLAHHAALPTLAGYTLLLSAIATLHSLGPADMQASRAALEHLVDRHPRAPEARVWLAKWHFLQLAQASAQDRDDELRRAKKHLARALDDEPGHALGLALSGHITSFADGDTAGAEQQLDRAVLAGPNESLATLFRAELLSNSDRADEAVAAVEKATALSPIDPLGYSYDLLAATAYSAAGSHQRALELTRRSLRRNALHLSTWVQLIIELVHTQRMDEARASARHYLVMRPGASVQRFLDRHPARGRALARSDADALLAAGLPP